jgi:hypothetical protein
LRHAIDVDHDAGCNDPAPDVDEKIGTAAEKLGVGMRFQRGKDFAERGRR